MRGIAPRCLKIKFGVYLPPIDVSTTLLDPHVTTNQSPRKSRPAPSADLDSKGLTNIVCEAIGVHPRFTENDRKNDGNGIALLIGYP